MALGELALSAQDAQLTRYQRDCRVQDQGRPFASDVAVFYATTRQPVARRDGDLERFFGEQREAESGGRLRVNYGLTTVSVPCRREPGQIARPADLLIFRIERPDPNAHFIVSEVQPMQRQDWLNRIAAQRELGDRRRETLLYVHGYNQSFNDAAYRAAQLHADLQVNGATVFYSWASRDNPLRYLSDRRTVESQAEVATLADLIQQLGVRNETLYVVAHSMGNRLTTAALAEMARGGAARPDFVDSLVLASADIEPGLFRNRWEQFRPWIGQAIIYASNRDRALLLGDLVAGETRLGDARRGLQVVDGAVTIDTSQVAGSGLGHDDYSSGGMADVQAALWFAVDPGRRCILVPSASARGAWQVSSETQAPRSCPHSAFSDALVVGRIRGSLRQGHDWLRTLGNGGPVPYLDMISSLLGGLEGVPGNADNLR